MKKIIIREIPDDLHLQFKLICVGRKTSMNQMLIELMLLCVKEGKKE
ncbi:hypothetical protein ES707_19736 [subsurface metagenome]